MAKVFRECLEKLIKAKKEFAPTQYPLASFENIAPKLQEEILKKAEHRFNYSHRTITDFYGYLFEGLHEAGLSQFDGTEAAAMYVVYHNALEMFPQFEALPFKERISLLRDAHKKAKRNERNLSGCAMNVYLLLVEKNLDNEVCLSDDGFAQKGSYDSPWRALPGEEAKRRTYRKDFQNFKKLADYDTGKVAVKHFPVWTSYVLKENYRGVKRTLLSVDLWTMLTER